MPPSFTCSVLEQETAPVLLTHLRVDHPRVAERLDALGDAVGRGTDAYLCTVMREYRRFILGIADGERAEGGPHSRLLPKKSGSHRDGRGHR